MPFPRLTYEEAVRLLTEAAFPPIGSLAAASKAASLSRSTLRRRIKTGELRGIRTRAGRGGRYRISRVDLAGLLVSMSA